MDIRSPEIFNSGQAIQLAVSDDRDERTKCFDSGENRTEDGRISVTEQGLTGTPRLVATNGIHRH